MARRSLPVAVLALATGLVLAFPYRAAASRAEIDGYGLPRLLKVDVSSLYYFPGTIGRASSRIQLDTGSGARLSDPGPNEVSGDAFAIAMLGEGFKYGYFLDGNSHNLVIGQGAWGLTLGFLDFYTEREIDTESQAQLSAESFRLSQRTLRMAFGWQHRTETGRVVEGTVAASWISSEGSASESRTSSGTEQLSEMMWESDGGYAVDAAFRTVTEGEGAVFSATYSYGDLRPRGVLQTEYGPVSLDQSLISREASMSLGYRSTPRVLDMLTLGLMATWSDGSEVNGQSTSPGLESTHRELYRGGVFLSAERHIVQRLVGRLGVQGLGEFVTNTRNRVYVYFDGTLAYRTDTTSNGRILPAEFFLGVSWTWKSIFMDARVQSSLSLDVALARWAVTVPF